MLQNIVSMKDTIILMLIYTEIQGFAIKKGAQNVVTGWFSMKNDQSNVTQVKLFIMTVKSLLEVQNTKNSEFRCY